MTEVYEHRDGSLLALQTVEHDGAVSTVSIYFSRGASPLNDMRAFNELAGPDLLERAQNGPYFLLSGEEYAPFHINLHEPDMSRDFTHVASVYNEEIHLHYRKMSSGLLESCGIVWTQPTD